MAGRMSNPFENGAPAAGVSGGLRRCARVLMGLGLVLVFAGVAGAGARDLDEVAVFCAYHALSGERLKDRDIEDLCWITGRPTFTAFKPAEMFSNRELRAVRRELGRRIRGLGPHSLFRWKPEDGRLRSSGAEDLPQATPLILAEMERNEWGRLLERRAAFTQKRSSGPGNHSTEITVLLQPVRVERREQERNIARVNVRIPVRCVVFRPVAIETGPHAGRGTPGARTPLLESGHRSSCRGDTSK